MAAKAAYKPPMCNPSSVFSTHRLPEVNSPNAIEICPLGLRLPMRGQTKLQADGGRTASVRERHVSLISLRCYLAWLCRS